MTALLTPAFRASGSNDSHNAWLSRSWATVKATVKITHGSKPVLLTKVCRFAKPTPNWGLANRD
ncbi:MAG: hypothetical protein CL902_08160 [Dehalococcoidia bacterium]|nr:hypothetical protein [Dehalococcoidia bacterium]